MKKNEYYMLKPQKIVELYCLVEKVLTYASIPVKKELEKYLLEIKSGRIKKTSYKNLYDKIACCYALNVKQIDDSKDNDKVTCDEENSKPRLESKELINQGAEDNKFWCLLELLYALKTQKYVTNGGIVEKRRQDRTLRR